MADLIFVDMKLSKVKTNHLLAIFSLSQVEKGLLLCFVEGWIKPNLATVLHTMVTMCRDYFCTAPTYHPIPLNMMILNFENLSFQANHVFWFAKAVGSKLNRGSDVNWTDSNSSSKQKVQ